MNSPMRANEAKHRRLVTVVLAALFFSAISCNVFNFGPAGEPTPPGPLQPTVDVSGLPPTQPRVVAQRPYEGEELRLDGSIDIYFDHPMDQASVVTALVLSPAIEAEVSWVDDSTLRVTPGEGALGRNDVLTITIGEGAQSRAGLAVAEAQTVTVQTVGYLEVGETYPAADSNGVETDSTITVFFNRPVVPLTVGNGAGEQPDPLTISPAVAGRGEWVNSSIYIFTPGTPLAGGQTYSATVAGGLTDQTGGVLTNAYSWEFTTLPPDVISVSPSSGDSDVVLDRDIEISFNQPMDPASTEAALSITGSNGGAVNGTLEWNEDGDTLTFMPSGLLPIETDITVQVGASAQSASGSVTLGGPVEWAFSTVRYPAVSATYPADGTADAYTWDGIAILFTAPIDEDTLEGKVTVDPAIAGDDAFYYSSWDNAWNIVSRLEPSTTYTVTVEPGIADPYGNTIDEPYSFSFTTGPYDPQVTFNTPSVYGLYDADQDTELFISYRNIGTINFELHRINENDYYDVFERYYYDDLPDLPDNQLLREWTLQSSGGLNEIVYEQVPVASADGGSLAPGVYRLTADSPQIAGTTVHYLIVTSANLTMKATFGETLIWATDIGSAQPISDADITILDQGLNAVGRGSTGSDGVARIGVPGVTDLWDTQYAIWDDGEHFALAVSDWGDSLSPWLFNIPAQFQQQEYTTYLYTDRPLYRPGQEVHFKGVIRAEAGDARYAVPTSGAARVTVTNYTGDIIMSQDYQLTEFGTFDGSFEIADDGALGYYNIEVGFGDRTSYLGIQVAEYRVPEFSVSVSSQPENAIVGEAVDFTADAEYYFGGTVNDAAVAWTLLAQQYVFDQYKGDEWYSFIDSDEINYWYEPGDIAGYGTVIAQGEGATDEDGRFTEAVDVQTIGEGSQRVTFEASISDVAGQPISGRSEVVIHASEVYVGVASQQYVYSVDETAGVNLITLEYNGKLLPDTAVEVQVFLREWNAVDEEDEFGRTQAVWEPEDTPVTDVINVTTDDKGEASIEFEPADPGTYRVVATVADDAGRENAASTYLWVSGRGYAAWRGSNTNQIDLVADRESYEVGDTAEVLITSPFSGSNVRALLTIERGSIKSYVVIPLESNSYLYRVPITADFAPNVYVSAVIISGGVEGDPVPAFRMGMVELPVDPSQQEINVSIEADPPQAGPRETVTYTVTTTDHTGNPVDAEVSLALADLATLSLANPNTGPILDRFYSERPISVQTAVPLIFLVDRVTQDLLDLGKGGGGGGADAAFFDVRSDFRDTAFWQARLQTGSTGTASVDVTLPDNLTTWRMDARAVTVDTMVGQVTHDLVASKPLLVRPATPRFFVAGDEAVLSASVNNNTNDDLTVDVTLLSEGITVIGDDMQTVMIPAGDHVQLDWSVVVNDNVEWVDVTFSAVADNGLSDAAKPAVGAMDHDRMLPVLRYEAPEIAGVSGQLSEAGESLEGVVLPPTQEVIDASLDIRVDASLAAAMFDALGVLRQQDYYSTETTVSRFLPNILALDALRQFGVERPDLEDALDQEINEALQKLYAERHVDGGWGWYKESATSPLVSAYVIYGLSIAQDAGYPVEQAVLNEGIAYLQGNLGDVDPLGPSYLLNRQAFILYVLADAGAPDVGRTGNLYEARESMDLYGWSLLAMTFHHINADDPRIDTLENALINQAIVSATGTHWEEERDDRFNWNTDTRTTAMVLTALTRIAPDNNLLPGAVRWLMMARRGSTWETSQESVWALIGLSEWMVASGELDGGYNWAVTFNGEGLDEGTVDGTTVTESQHLAVDITQMSTDGVNRLGITRGEGPGRLYYTAHLTAYLPVETLEPLSRGVMVERRFLNADGEWITEGVVGDRVTVEVTIIAPHDLYFLHVQDPYPAGAEGINTALLTESVVNENRRIEPYDPLSRGWGWWYFSRTEIRDEMAVITAEALPAGTYQFVYEIRLAQVGQYRVIPPVAYETYMPEVYGRGTGSIFTVLPGDE